MIRRHSGSIIDSWSQNQMDLWNLIYMKIYSSWISGLESNIIVHILPTLWISFANTKVVSSWTLLSDTVLPIYYCCWVVCLIPGPGFSSPSSSAPSSPDVDDTWESLGNKRILWLWQWWTLWLCRATMNSSSVPSSSDVVEILKILGKHGLILPDEFFIRQLWRGNLTLCCLLHCPLSDSSLSRSWQLLPTVLSKNCSVAN